MIEAQLSVETAIGRQPRLHYSMRCEHGAVEYRTIDQAGREKQDALHISYALHSTLKRQTRCGCRLPDSMQAAFRAWLGTPVR